MIDKLKRKYVWNFRDQQGGLEIPEMIEIKTLILNIPLEEKFRDCGGAEFMRMRNCIYTNGPLALCYKAGPHNNPGEVYGFDKEKEAIWLRWMHGTQKLYPADCCQYCGDKLTSDIFSSNYGDWCANESCCGK